jgi:hypothetical protein
MGNICNDINTLEIWKMEDIKNKTNITCPYTQQYSSGWFCLLEKDNKLRHFVFDKCGKQEVHNDIRKAEWIEVLVLLTLL